MASGDVGGDERNDIGGARLGVSLGVTWPRAVVLSVACLLTHARASAEPPTGSVERLKADVYYLASGTLEGRGISTPGVDLAARHIRAEFRRIGLKSGTPDGSYFQPFEYRRTAQAAATMLHNVIGVLEGEGPAADETIVIGAHYDHLGHGEVHSAAPGPRRAHPPRGRRQRIGRLGDAGTGPSLRRSPFAAPPTHGFHRFLRRGGRAGRQPILCLEAAPVPDQGHGRDDELRHGRPTPRRRAGDRRQRIGQGVRGPAGRRRCPFAASS